MHIATTWVATQQRPRGCGVAAPGMAKSGTVVATPPDRSLRPPVTITRPAEHLRQSDVLGSELCDRRDSEELHGALDLGRQDLRGPFDRSPPAISPYR